MVMKEMRTEDGALALTPEGIDLEESTLRNRTVFTRQKNMVWVEFAEPPKPDKPCASCKAPNWGNDVEFEVGSVISCLKCGAYWRCYEIGSSSFVIPTYWEMVVPEPEPPNENGWVGASWVVVQREARDWLGRKVQKRYTLSSR